MCCGKCEKNEIIGKLSQLFFANGLIYSAAEEADAEEIRLMPDDKSRMFAIKCFEVFHGKKFPLNAGLPFLLATNIQDISTEAVQAGIDFLLANNRIGKCTEQLELDFMTA